MSIVRHFTATAFVVHEQKVLLHWHPKVKAWLPPGGHIEENEDPVQAVLREVREESGVQAFVIPTSKVPDLAYPPQVLTPYTILVEDIDDPVDGYHQHIDMIYFCDVNGKPGPLNDGWTWVPQQDLVENRPISGGAGPAVPAPEDVRVLALNAVKVLAEKAGPTTETGSIGNR